MSAGKMKFSRQIPAQIGYFVLRILTDRTGYPEELELEKDSVLAWAFEEGDERSIPYPVTMKGVQTDSPSVLEPRGLVDSAVAKGSLPLNDWLSEIQTKHRRRAKNGGGK